MLDGFWAEAVNTAVYLSNRSPSSPLKDQTPFEVWSRKKPSMLSLCTFSSIVWAYIPKANRKKFDATSVRCIMLRYTEGQKAYRLWVPAQQKIILAESIYFDEDSLLQDCTDDSLPLTDLFTDKRPPMPNQDTCAQDSHPDPPPTGDKDTVINISSPIPSSPITPSNPPPLSDQPQCTRREPAWHQLNSSKEAFRKAAELPPISHKPTDTAKDTTYYINLAEHIIKEEHTRFAYSAVTLNTEAKLKSYKEAIHSLQSEEWLEAIEDKKNSLIALSVFETIKHSDVPKD